ncbi:hypothetical protein Aduo_002044 [Ancylostoma duodenale]
MRIRSSFQLRKDQIELLTIRQDGISDDRSVTLVPIGERVTCLFVGHELLHVLAQLVLLIVADLLDGSNMSRGKGGEQRLHLFILLNHSHHDLLELRFRRLVFDSSRHPQFF